MSGTGSHSGSGVGGAIRKGVGLVHGTGEAIRGNVNAAVDSATGDHAAAARNQAIASRGVDEMEHGHYHGTGAGVTPVDTHPERINRAAQGESAYPGSTNYGPHATNLGNKLDPRFDSDVDHRGTAMGSTNYGPHGTNVGNRVDPRVDETDHRASQFHAPGIAHIFEPNNQYPEHVRRGSVPDPRDQPADPAYDAYSHLHQLPYDNHPDSLHGTFEPPRRADTMPHADPLRYGQELSRHERRSSRSSQHAPHSSRVMNILDPRVGAAAPIGERHSTQYPHQNGFMNLLDPRVDAKEVRSEKIRRSIDEGYRV